MPLFRRYLVVLRTHDGRWTWWASRDSPRAALHEARWLRRQVRARRNVRVVDLTP